MSAAFSVNGFMLSLNKLMLLLEYVIKGKMGISDEMEKLTTQKHNSFFEPIRTTHDYLSSDKQKVDETLEYLIYLHFIISLGIFASFHQKEVEKALTPLTKEMKYLWGASSAICAYSFYIVYEEKEAMGHEETEGHGGGHGGGH